MPHRAHNPGISGICSTPCRAMLIPARIPVPSRDISTVTYSRPDPPHIPHCNPAAVISSRPHGYRWVSPHPGGGCGRAVPAGTPNPRQPRHNPAASATPPRSVPSPNRCNSPGRYPCGMWVPSTFTDTHARASTGAMTRPPDVTPADTTQHGSPSAHSASLNARPPSSRSR